MFDLGPAAERVAGLLAATRDEQLSDATPCPNTIIGDLVDHIGTLTLAFTAKAEKRDDGMSSPPPPPSGANLRAGWRERIGHDLERLVAAWRDPAAWRGMTKAGGIDLPTEVAGLVVLDELIVHGSPEACREHIARYVENGVDTPVLAIAGVDSLHALRQLAPR